MAILIADIETLLGQASSAMASSQWNEARTFLMRAKTLLIGVADGGKDGADHKFYRDQIDSLIEECKESAIEAAAIGAETGGIGFIKLTQEDARLTTDETAY